MSRKVPVKIGQCSKAMLEGFYGKASYFRSLLNVVLLKYSFYSAAQLFTYLSCFRCIDMLCHDLFLL